MKILLVCNAGMSTSIMQLKLQEEAVKYNLQMEIAAIPLSEIEENLVDCKAVLLGPQIRFALDDVCAMVDSSIPVILISLQDFGLMQVDHVWEQLFQEINESQSLIK